jgi:hypothetical protein
MPNGAIMVMGSSWVKVKVRTFSFGADSCAATLPAITNALSSKIAIRFIEVLSLKICYCTNLTA